MADLPNGKLCVASYHMWRLYPTRITTRSTFGLKKENLVPQRKLNKQVERNRTMEFFLNESKLSLNSVNLANSGNLINH